MKVQCGSAKSRRAVAPQEWQPPAPRLKRGRDQGRGTPRPAEEVAAFAFDVSLFEEARDVRIAVDRRLLVRLTNETVLKGVNMLPLFAGFAGLAVLLLAMSAT
ncbi:MAG TPA: hypothetical protein DIC56_17685 [Rhizobium sp.]|nr:hypothetical protein [Rhizobium sp.]